MLWLNWETKCRGSCEIPPARFWPWSGAQLCPTKIRFDWLLSVRLLQGHLQTIISLLWGHTKRQDSMLPAWWCYFAKYFFTTWVWSFHYSPIMKLEGDLESVNLHQGQKFTLQRYATLHVHSLLKSGHIPKNIMMVVAEYSSSQLCIYFVKLMFGLAKCKVWMFIFKKLLVRLIADISHWDVFSCGKLHDMSFMCFHFNTLVWKMNFYNGFCSPVKPVSQTAECPRVKFYVWAIPEDCWYLWKRMSLCFYTWLCFVLSLLNFVAIPCLSFLLVAKAKCLNAQC